MDSYDKIQIADFLDENFSAFAAKVGIQEAESLIDSLRFQANYKPEPNQKKKACKTPCAECPFRKDSIKGYLGGFTVEETFNAAKSEDNFDCHLTREKGQQRKHCAGRLLHAKKMCKSFRSKELEEAKNEVAKNNSLDNILGFDFLNHHNLNENT